jgi:beta-glucosidase
MPIQAINQFPPGFLWGCATAAHHVEGQNVNDWWRWEHQPGRIFQGQRAGRACDWWSGRFVEDFDRAAALNNNAQRISVEWSRVEPEPGRWDDWALDHYRDMLRALRARDMKPMVTLHHFTSPLWVGDQNGWLWDETPVHFERFVRKVVSALGDLCSLWCTINEPNSYATLGYQLGRFPPGMKDLGAARRVMRNMALGHAAAYYAIKELQPESQVGVSVNYIGIRPAAPRPLHQLAARMIDSYFNLYFLNILRDGVARMPGSRSVRMPKVKGTLDWIGLQYYMEYEAALDLRQPGSLFLAQRKPKGLPPAPTYWGGFDPGAIHRHIRRLWGLLGKPIYITESGTPDPDDSYRPRFLAETIRAVWQAMNYNFPVLGYFHWSLLDNFEWAEGYDPRFNFGLYKVDFQTQERTARPSAHLYAEICARNGLSSETVARHVPDLLPTLFPGEAGQSEVKLKPRESAV